MRGKWATRQLWGMFGILAVSFCSVAFAHTSFATSPDWFSGTPSVELFDDTRTPSTVPTNVTAGDCTWQEVRYKYAQPPFYRSVRACVHQANSFQLAHMTDCVPDWYGNCSTIHWTAIRFGSDNYFYRANIGTGSGPYCWRTQAASNDVVYACNGRMSIIYDLPMKVVRHTDINGAYYDAKPGAVVDLADENGSVVSVGATVASKDKKWLVFEARNYGLVRMNMEDKSLHLFTKDVRPYGYGSDPTYEFSITNDGKYVAVGGNNAGASIYSISGACGEASANFKSTWRQKVAGFQECPKQDLVWPVMNVNGGTAAGFRYFKLPSFNYDDGVLEGYYVPYRTVNGGKVSWVRFTATRYVSSTQPIEYLALGDSFSSGEGDTEKFENNEKFYRDLTDIKGNDELGIPQEMCHLSLRSYPYILAENMGLGAPGIAGQTDWQSVACSGAVAADDYRLSEVYNGQNARLKDYIGATELREDALINYVPGRVEQYNFVQRDQPKTLTITAGGNDVGFGEIIKKCALPGTCDYAEGKVKTAALAHTIQDQRQKLANLYSNIHDLSPNTKIYVVGYPQFISEDYNCRANVQLNEDERSFTRQAVTFMNEIIAAAANDAGVHYIDLEDVLGTNALCGNEESYVSGINRDCLWVFGIGSGDDCQESFHPNHLGHQAMANRINADIGDLRSFEYCPDGKTTCPSDGATIEIPPLLQSALDTTTFAQDNDTKYSHKTIASENYARKNPHATFNIQLDGLQPNSTGNADLASTPTTLGTFTADSTGKVDVTFTVPANIPAGDHTLSVDVKSFSGEPLHLWQIVTIYGADGDLDEDGIVDSEDTCMFVTPANADFDGDGVDDGCDLYIGPEVDKKTTSTAKPGPFLARNTYTNHADSSDNLERQTLFTEDDTDQNLADSGVSGKNKSIDEGEVKGTSTSVTQSAKNEKTDWWWATIPILLMLFVTMLLLVYTKRRRKTI